MNPVSLGFVEAAPASAPAAAAAAASEGKPATDGFGDLIQEFLAQAVGAGAEAPAESKGGASLDEEPADAETERKKDGAGDQTPSEVMNLFATSDLLRTMPVPMPPEERTVADATSEIQNHEIQPQPYAIDALAVPADVAGSGASEESEPDDAKSAPADTPLKNPIAADRSAREEALQQRELHSQSKAEARGPKLAHPAVVAAVAQKTFTGAAALADTTGKAEKANDSRATKDTKETKDTKASDNLGGPQWRRAVMTRLAELIDSTSDTPSRRLVPVPPAPEIARALAALTDHASTEHRSIVSTSLSASGVSEVPEMERLTTFDRLSPAPLLQMRLDPTVAAPLRLAADASAPANATPPMVVIDEPTLDANLPEQIVQSIRVQALDLGGEARVRLRPEYLGEVVVSVKVDRGAVTATLQADTPAVRRWIETNEAALRVGLADHGLHLDRLTVSEPAKAEPESGERRRQSSREQEHPERRESRNSGRNEETGTFEVVV